MSRHSGFLLSLLAVAILAVWAGLYLRRFLGADSPSHQAPSRDVAADGWARLDGCRLIEDRGNDGDSFRVEHQGERQVFRLYFVDCPEKRRHQYNGERIRDQGRYFDGLGEERVLALGEQAREFALAELGRAPFQIWTRWDMVFDSGRAFAFVTLPDGKDLGERLVSQGLARIHTQGWARPDGTSERQARARLRQLEGEAKRAGRGGWRR